MKSKKVYCRDCRYYKVDWTSGLPAYSDGSGGGYVCKSPNNIKFLDCYYSRELFYERYPSGINKDNDCVYYHRKWWEIWK